MTDIIDFQKAKERFSQREEDLTTLLKKAVLLKDQSRNFEGFIVNLSPPQFKKLIGSKIVGVVLEQKKIEKETLFCVDYVASLLTRMLNPSPIKSWKVVDYLLEFERRGEQKLLKDGAEICFFCYSVFLWPQEAQTSLWENVGSSLYLKFYGISQEVVAYYMSNRFSQMGKIVNKSILSLKEERGK